MFLNMALFRSFSISVLFYAFVFICSVSSSTYVPVLIWDSVKNDNSISALNHIHSDDFKDILTERLQNKNTNLYIFQEESLSPEDMRGSFKKISKLSDKYHMTYYPSVERPVDVLRKINKNVKEISYNKLKNLKPVSGETYIINLNDAKDNEDREQMLIRHDNIIYTDFKNIVNGDKHVIVMYTGKRSSWEMPTEQFSDSSRQRRETKPNENEQSNNYIIVSNQLLGVYASSNSTLTVTDKDKKETSSNLVSCGTDFINDNSTEISFCISPSRKVTFSFVSRIGYWYIQEIEIPITVDGKDETILINNTAKTIYAPMLFSFHCGKLSFTKKFGENIYTLTLPDFQTEYFTSAINETSLRFSSAYDCVGFTTGPIWSALFVIFILSLIMTFGLCMIMDIKTMDRFDDPKGKTISINASD